MLEIISSNFLKASNYLIDNYPQDKTAIVHVMEGYDTIETPEGFGFGVFVPEKLEIFIAGDMPGGEESLIKTLAHEYKHFMQYCEGKPFNEEEAEEFAEKIYKKITQPPGEGFRKIIEGKLYDTGKCTVIYKFRRLYTDPIHFVKEYVHKAWEDAEYLKTQKGTYLFYCPARKDLQIVSEKEVKETIRKLSADSYIRIFGEVEEG